MLRKVPLSVLGWVCVGWGWLGLTACGGSGASDTGTGGAAEPSGTGGVLVGGVGGGGQTGVGGEAGIGGNAGGGGDVGSDEGVPEPPTGLAAAAGQGAVQLAWHEVAGIDTYTLYWSADGTDPTPETGWQISGNCSGSCWPSASMVTTYR